MKALFKGVATALYTPFKENEIDFEFLDQLIEEQLDAKIDCLVILGTTGESPTITNEERKRIIEFSVNKVKGKIPIIIGTGSNCTSSAVELTLQAKNLKADGALVVTPYYNKCEQEGLIAHYNKICNEAKFPVICYNVPKRTCTNINANSFSCILNNDYVFGIKEASDDINQIYEIINVAKNKVAVYCGNDSLNLEFLQLGASGFISVASNIIPLKIKDIFLNFANNYKCKAKDIHDNLKDFYFALFSKTNPIPVKAMAEILYDKKQNLRLPLTRANDNDFTYYKQILSNYFKL